jgi:hypothetical protein
VEGVVEVDVLKKKLIVKSDDCKLIHNAQVANKKDFVKNVLLENPVCIPSLENSQYHNFIDLNSPWMKELIGKTISKVSSFLDYSSYSIPEYRPLLTMTDGTQYYFDGYKWAILKKLQ